MWQKMLIRIQGSHFLPAKIWKLNTRSRIHNSTDFFFLSMLQLSIHFIAENLCLKWRRAYKGGFKNTFQSKTLVKARNLLQNASFPKFLSSSFCRQKMTPWMGIKTFLWYHGAQVHDSQLNYYAVPVLAVRNNFLICPIALFANWLTQFFQLFPRFRNFVLFTQLRHFWGASRIDGGELDRLLEPFVVDFRLQRRQIWTFKAFIFKLFQRGFKLDG